MAQNIVYSPWEGTKVPWLCLMTTLSLFGLLWLFSFVSVFLTSLIKLILWLKFVHSQKTGRGQRGLDHKGLLRVTLRSQAAHLLRFEAPTWLMRLSWDHIVTLQVPNQTQMLQRTSQRLLLRDLLFQEQSINVEEGECFIYLFIH